MHENHKDASHVPRVLLVSPVPPPYGGIARWTRTLMDMDPAALGIELVLINTAHREQRSDETTLAARAITGVAQTLRVLGSLAAHFARRGRPDCVHINSSGSLGLIRDLLVLGLCRLLRVRSVLHLRFGRAPELLQRQPRRIESRLLAQALKLASTTISIDRQTHIAVTAAIGPKQSVLIPNFINTASYSPRFDRQDKTVLFLGSVSHSKGVKELLAAWDSLNLKGWSLRLVGPLSPSTKDLVAMFREDPAVEVLGSAEHSLAMAHMYKAAFMVLPSHTEGFPNVVLEGMATGTPIIASAVGAIPEMLGEGAGIVIPPKDVEALKKSILYLATEFEARSRMAQRAYERVSQQYSTGAVIAQYCRVWVS